VTWQHPYTRSIRPAGVLTCGTEGFTFAYVARADEVDEVDEVDGFQPFMGFADLHRRYTSPQLFPLFAQRVMRATGLPGLPPRARTRGRRHRMGDPGPVPG
jgi:hypothetical protein